jgi:hypothetical protein
MFKRGLMAAVAAASMVATPVLAQSSASKLSVASSVRASADAKGEKLAGGSVLIGVLVFAAVVGVIYAVAEGNDESASA